MKARVMWAILPVLVIGGCLFRRGGPREPEPVETVDTTQRRADSLYQVGAVHFRAGKWNDAIFALDRALLIMDYANPRRARGYFMLAEAQFASGSNLEAVRQFRRVADESSSDSLAADALLRAGDAYADLWRRPELDPSYGETAVFTYSEVLERYPGTSAAQRAQMRIVELQQLFAEKEYKTARFYLRYKAYDSAILVLRNLIATYPRAPIVPDALASLVDAYQKLDYQEDVQDTCQYIRQFFPQVIGRVEQCQGTAPPPPR